MGWRIVSKPYEDGKPRTRITKCKTTEGSLPAGRRSLSRYKSLALAPDALRLLLIGILFPNRAAIGPVNGFIVAANANFIALHSNDPKLTGKKFPAQSGVLRSFTFANLKKRALRLLHKMCKWRGQVLRIRLHMRDSKIQ